MMHLFVPFLSGITLFYTFQFFPLTTCIIFFSLSVIILMKNPTANRSVSKNSTPLLIFFIIIGFLYAFFRYSPPLDPSFISSREIIIDCVADDSPRELFSGRFVNEVSIKRAIDADTGEYFTLLQGKEMSIISDEGLRQRTRYVITAKPARERERLNPGMIKSDKLYAYLTGVKKSEILTVNLIITWFQDRRDRLNQYLKSNFESDS